ncbi:MAG: diadenylate cyclase [Thermodesulfobacteriota bacterium]
MNYLAVVNAIGNWRSLLDIFLLAAGIFFLYRTLLSLGTWKIVTGILLAVIVFLVASLLDLKGIEWVYRHVSHVALIAVIVIFQPELRKIFERAALLRGTRSVDQGAQLAELVAGSMWKLAAQRWGAILVLPGREPVNEWLSGGFALNGTPSEPLIMSIFDPGSPGHDGAVVLHNGSFTMFGVRLPMSRSTGLAEEYGTRHHAAMGMSEQSDALVIVVSEERGRISLFKRGEMTPAADAGAVSRAIVNHWRESATTPFEFSKIKRRKKAVSQMAVSLIIALLIWIPLIFEKSESVERMISVPVQYTLSSSRLMLVGDRPTEVRLHMAGSMADLDRLLPSELSVQVDISKAVEGRQTFYITEDSLQLPKGVQLLDVSPSSLELEFAAIRQKEISVEPQLVGKLKEGLEVLSIETRPDKILAMIPSGEDGDLITSVTTTPVYLESIQKSTKIFCKIVAPPSVQPVADRWPDVEVYIRLKKPAQSNP